MATLSSSRGRPPFCGFVLRLDNKGRRRFQISSGISRRPKFEFICQFYFFRLKVQGGFGTGSKYILYQNRILYNQIKKIRIVSVAISETEFIYVILHILSTYMMIASDYSSFKKDQNPSIILV